jgi:dimethylargininase
MSGGTVRDRLLPDQRRGRVLVLVRRPGPRFAEGLLTHIDRSPVDLDRAHAQWAGYVAAFEANGWPVIEVEPAVDCPDAPFIEDTMVVGDDFVVIARPGAVARQPETAGAADAVRALGMDVVEILAPGTLDGGDVLKLGSRWFVGVGRTNYEGVRQLTGLTAARGITVVPIPISGV